MVSMVVCAGVICFNIHQLQLSDRQDSRSPKSFWTVNRRGGVCDAEALCHSGMFVVEASLLYYGTQSGMRVGRITH
jgi:hypothetical protein